MNTTPLAPSTFIKANFTINIDGKDYSFLNLPVSSYGISGIRWNLFNPLDFVGKQVKVTLDVLSRNRFRLTCDGFLSAEVGLDSLFLGVKFSLSNEDKTKLNAAIDSEGFCPTNYIRKFPRIPASENIKAMPLRAIIQRENDLVVFDIANLSPSGFLLSSENPKVSEFLPNTRFYAQIEPRGDSVEPFGFEGIVLRILVEKNLKTGNLIRLLGVKILSLSEIEKNRFLEILKLILKEITKK